MARKAKSNNRITALYLRISREDENKGESYSIESQRIILRQEAQKQGLTNLVEYIDDGITGVSFEAREALLRLLSDAYNGLISTLLVKDGSRFGRNAAMVLYTVMNEFPRLNVRFIALGENYDSGNKGQHDDMMFSFKAIFNEEYAKDISIKTRSVYKARALMGEAKGGRAPYGYIWDVNAKKKLIIDPETAETVRQIFTWAAEGVGQMQITVRLRNMQILKPTALNEKRGHGWGYTNKNTGKVNWGKQRPGDYNWNIQTIRSMLANPVYAGHTARNRSTTESFKIKRRIEISPEDWIVTKDTHEAIVDQKTFDLAQKSLTIKRKPDSSGELNIFQGFLICPDCGAKMGFSKNEGGGRASTFRCNTNRTTLNRGNNLECTPHTIQYNHLYSVVLAKIVEVHGLFKEFSIEELEVKYCNLKRVDMSAESKKSLTRLQARAKEIFIMIKSATEKNALGNMDDLTYNNLLQDWQTEQKETLDKIEKLEKAINETNQDKAGIRKLAAEFSAYDKITTLSHLLLKSVLEKVFVHQATAAYGNKNRKQHVAIHFRFVGNIDGIRLQ